MNIKSTFMKFTKKTHLSESPSLLGLAALLLVCTFLSPVFWTFTNWTNIMRQSVILGICSLGLTFVILTGHNDLSIQGVLSMSAVLTGVLLPTLGLPLTMLAVVIVGALVGCMNGTVLSIWNMEPFVATYGVQTLATGVGYLFSGGIIVILKKMPANALALANAKVVGLPICFMFLIVLYIIADYILKHTKFGRYVYAVGGNSEVCYLSGVSVRRIRILVYMINGFCAALAGVFLFSRTTVGDPTSGGTYTLQSISAVIIGGSKFSGGIGNVFNTIIGVLIVGIISNVLNLMGASYYLQLVIQGLIIVIAVAISSKRRKD